jgi:hypothetical protein
MIGATKPVSKQQPPLLQLLWPEQFLLSLFKAFAIGSTLSMGLHATVRSVRSS